MTEKEIDKILKPKRKYILLFLLYFSIALVCIGFAFYGASTSGNKKMEEDAVSLRELTTNKEALERRRVTLDFEKIPIQIASNYDKDNSLYYVTDTENNIYIASISKETFKDITEQIDLETGRLCEVYEIRGVATPIDEKIQNLAILSGFKVFKNKELNQDNFSELLGTVYVKEYSNDERIVTFYICIALFGVFFLILALGYLLPGIIKAGKTLKNKELMEEIRKELENLTDTRYKKLHLYFTRNYMVTGIQAIKYEDIVKCFIKVELKYGIKVGENLVVETKDKKEYTVASVVGNNGVLQDVLNDLVLKNSKIEVLTTDENKNGEKRNGK